MAEQELAFELTEAAKDALAEEGYEPEFGARPLKRAIQKHVQNLLADAILSGELRRGDTARVDFVAGEYTLASIDHDPEVVEALPGQTLGG
jgi:ATP-dependent Clp protease ATP-binding subunit ClpA